MVYALLRLTVSALLIVIGGAAAVHGAQGAFISEPPVNYLRQIEIRVTDITGAPLAGVRAEITPLWCQIVGGGPLVSDDLGRIRFQLQPVVENPMAEKTVTDRFLTFRSVFMYRLLREGYMEQVGEIEDEQEFASFYHPLYYGLNRQPTDKPLVILETLLEYQDFLARPRAGAGLRPVIESLTEAGPAANIRLTPGSLDQTPEGTFRIGFGFRPLFDPEKFGLVEAGEVLLRKPVRDTLGIIKVARGGFQGIRGFRFRITAQFQYQNAPFPEPVPQTYEVAIPVENAARILDWKPARPFPLQGITMRVEDRGLDLTAELFAGGPKNDDERKEKSP